MEAPIPNPLVLTCFTIEITEKSPKIPGNGYTVTPHVDSTLAAGFSGAFTGKFGGFQTLQMLFKGAKFLLIGP